MKESEKVPSIEMVKEFHETFGHPIAYSPVCPSLEMAETRMGFILSEIEEFMEAVKNGDIVEAGDALGDIQYFLDGTFLIAGLADKKDAIMAEIQRSNMSKSCMDEFHAHQTISHLLESNPNEIYHVKMIKQGVWVVYDSVGKVMKALGYSKPDLKKIVYGE